MARQRAGPFQITLSAAQDPVKAGDVRLTDDVERGGMPVKGAAVKLTLPVPSVGMPGPSAPLAWQGERSTGTVKAGTAGDWQAEVAVEASGQNGTAAFTFPAKE